MEKRIFISHSSRDAALASAVCERLEKEGIGCWIAPRDIPYGDKWAAKIVNGIRSSKLFLFLLTENSNTSKHCVRELNNADHADIPLLCVKTDKAIAMNDSLSYYFNDAQVLTAETMNEDALSRILDAVRYGLHEEKEALSVSSSGDFVIEDGTLIKYMGNADTVLIPDGVIGINEDAFENAYSMRSLFIPDSVEYIFEEFSENRALEEIFMSSNIMMIPSTAFLNTKWYQDQPDGWIYLNRILMGYKGSTKRRASLEMVHIKEGTQCVAVGAFNGCENISEIDFPDSLLSFIGLEEYIPARWYKKQKTGMVYAGKIALLYKGQFPEDAAVFIKPGTKAIAAFAFAERDISYIDIPESVIYIGVGALGGVLDAAVIHNPQCVIHSDSDDFDPLTIYGHKGSTAEEYAQINEIDFKCIVE